MQATRNPWRPAALGVAVILIASACGSQASPAPSGGASVAPRISAPAASGPAASASASGGASAPASIPQGGTLSIGWNGEIQWLDPSLGYDVNSWPAERLIFEPLMAYDSGTNL